jgi:hypothetical protein
MRRYKAPNQREHLLMADHIYRKQSLALAESRMTIYYPVLEPSQLLVNN